MEDKLTKDQISNLLNIVKNTKWSGEVNVQENAVELLQQFLKDVLDWFDMIDLPKSLRAKAIKFLLTNRARAEYYNMFEKTNSPTATWDAVVQMLHDMVQGTNDDEMTLTTKIFAIKLVDLAYTASGAPGKLVHAFANLDMLCSKRAVPLDSSTLCWLYLRALPPEISSLVALDNVDGQPREHREPSRVKEAALAYSGLFDSLIAVHKSNKHVTGQPRQFSAATSPNSLRGSGASPHSTKLPNSSVGPHRRRDPLASVSVGVGGIPIPPTSGSGSGLGAGTGSGRPAASATPRPQHGQSTNIERAVPRDKRFKEPTGQATALYIRNMSKALSDKLRASGKCLLCRKGGHRLADCAKRDASFASGQFFYYQKK
jgi:hypothetical protein